MGNTTQSPIDPGFFLSRFTSLDNYNVLKSHIHKDNIHLFQGTYLIVIYAFFNKHKEVNILYSLCKTHNDIQVKNFIIGYYEIDRPAINKKILSDPVYFLWKNLDDFKYTASYPQFIINFCDSINAEDFIDILNAFVKSYVIQNAELVVQQIDFLQLLGCKLVNRSEELKIQVEKIIDRYLRSDIKQIDVVKFFVGWNLFDIPMKYNNFKYCQFVLASGLQCDFVDKLTDGELLSLLMSNNLASCMLVKQINSMADKDNIIAIIKHYINDYAFPNYIINNNNLSLVEAYYDFLIDAYDIIAAKEVVKFIKKLIYYNNLCTSIMRINMAMISKLFSKTNIDAINTADYTIFDYYLAESRIDNDIIDIFMHHEIKYGDESLKILSRYGIKIKNTKITKSVSLI